MKKERPYVGHAVANKKIRFTSVSQIVLFDPKHEGCNRKWWFPYVAGKKLTKTDALAQGINYSEKLEHYLTTGENVLPPVLQEAVKFLPAPGPDLECEQPLGLDFVKAVELRDVQLSPHPKVGAQYLQPEIQRLAGLTILGVPVDGAADFRHQRGYYQDENGVLTQEHPATRVVEIGDLKTTSRISSRKILKGASAGQILPGYAKTSAQVCAHPQMVGYARHALDRYPGLTHVRLSHIYAQTSSKGAAKRTGLVSVEHVFERWDGMGETFAKMIQVATAERVQDVEPSPSSCDAYTHVGPNGEKLKGCGHRYYCPQSDSVIVQNMLAPYKESAMSLFDRLPASVLPPGMAPSAPGPMAPPTPPSLDAAAERAAIEAEKAKLLAEDGIGACGTPGCGVGCAPGWIQSPTGGSGAFVQCPTCKKRALAEAIIEQEAALKAPPAPPPPLPGILSPDVPPAPALIDAADPLPEAVRSEITDPELKQRVEQHAAEHQARDEAQAAVKEATGASVWCAGSSQRIVVTTEMAVNREKYICKHCGKAIALKPAKQADGSYLATISKHKPVKPVEGDIAPPPPPNQLSLTPPAPPTSAHPQSWLGKAEPSVPPVMSTIAPPPPPVGEMTQMVNDMFVAPTNGHAIQNGGQLKSGEVLQIKPVLSSTEETLQAILQTLRELCELLKGRVQA